MKMSKVYYTAILSKKLDKPLFHSNGMILIVFKLSKEIII